MVIKKYFSAAEVLAQRVANRKAGIAFHLDKTQSI